MKPQNRLLRDLAACGVLAMLTGSATAGSLAKLDTDRNGSGSRSEFDAYMKKDVFTRVDASGDGKVTLGEWQEVNPKVDAAKFQKADANRDGAITRTEADAAFDREGSLDRLFKQIDADGNGSLSEAEISAFRAKVQQQPGSNPIEKTKQAASQP